MPDPADVPCIQMRGGTSKGAYFLASDLPADAAERDDLLLRILGTPDPRQIDGIGGGHPLASKVAVVSPSAGSDTDVDYLFLQAGVDEAFVTDRQNCGNILAGVGPFAVERGLVEPASAGGQTRVRIHLVNTGESATAAFATSGGSIDYSEPVLLEFPSPAGTPLLPTGRVVDVLDGVSVTCVDLGMPVVVIAAADLGVTGEETPAELEADKELAARIRSVRIEALKLMGLGDAPSLPKISLLSPPRNGGTISTRTFIPVRCHEAIGVLGAASVGAALLIPGAVGADLAVLSPAPGGPLRLEHPSGFLDIVVELDPDAPADRPRALRSGLARTARKLFEGTVFPRPA